MAVLRAALVAGRVWGPGSGLSPRGWDGGLPKLHVEKEISRKVSLAHFREACLVGEQVLIRVLVWCGLRPRGLWP